MLISRYTLMLLHLTMHNACFFILGDDIMNILGDFSQKKIFHLASVRVSLADLRSCLIVIKFNFGWILWIA